MAKKPKSLSAWLTPKLRNIARMWPEKNKARAKAARRVQIGLFKNGKPEFRTMYECSGCNELFAKEETQMDHTDPVVDPAVGFTDWNTYINRLFCNSDGYTCMCKECHLVKTLDENDQRREVKKKVKK